ncbi:hypothetical protein R50912_25255 [Paenibacillus sp. FSL R5-0912]|nr:hypothetical protein R50912_25255 [Paenibacillus sp. FSL R5-0912]
MPFIALTISQESAAPGFVLNNLSPYEVSYLLLDIIYLVQLIKHKVSSNYAAKDNIKVIRPGYGLAPKYYDLLLGKPMKKDLKSWEQLL